MSGAQSDTRPVLTRGSAGEEVGKLQAALRKLGHPIAVDDDFGAATELAVMSFQQSHGLLADGIVGKETWDALKTAAK